MPFIFHSERNPPFGHVSYEKEPQRVLPLKPIPQSQGFVVGMQICRDHPFRVLHDSTTNQLIEMAEDSFKSDTRKKISKLRAPLKKSNSRQDSIRGNKLSSLNKMILVEELGALTVSKKPRKDLLPKQTSKIKLNFEKQVSQQNKNQNNRNESGIGPGSYNPMWKTSVKNVLFYRKEEQDRERIMDERIFGLQSLANNEQFFGLGHKYQISACFRSKQVKPKINDSLKSLLFGKSTAAESRMESTCSIEQNCIGPGSYEPLDCLQRNCTKQSTFLKARGKFFKSPATPGPGSYLTSVEVQNIKDLSQRNYFSHPPFLISEKRELRFQQSPPNEFEYDPKITIEQQCARKLSSKAGYYFGSSGKRFPTSKDTFEDPFKSQSITFKTAERNVGISMNFTANLITRETEDFGQVGPADYNVTGHTIEHRADIIRQKEYKTFFYNLPSSTAVDWNQLRPKLEVILQKSEQIQSKKSPRNKVEKKSPIHTSAKWKKEKQLQIAFGKRADASVKRNEVMLEQFDGYYSTEACWSKPSFNVNYLGM